MIQRYLDRSHSFKACKMWTTFSSSIIYQGNSYLNKAFILVCGALSTCSGPDHWYQPMIRAALNPLTAMAFSSFELFRNFCCQIGCWSSIQSLVTSSSPSFWATTMAVGRSDDTNCIWRLLCKELNVVIQATLLPGQYWWLDEMLSVD